MMAMTNPKWRWELWGLGWVLLGWSSGNAGQPARNVPDEVFLGPWQLAHDPATRVQIGPGPEEWVARWTHVSERAAAEGCQVGGVAFRVRPDGRELRGRFATRVGGMRRLFWANLVLLLAPSNQKLQGEFERVCLHPDTGVEMARIAVEIALERPTGYLPPAEAAPEVWLYVLEAASYHLRSRGVLTVQRNGLLWTGHAAEVLPGPNGAILQSGNVMLEATQEGQKLTGRLLTVGAQQGEKQRCPDVAAWSEITVTLDGSGQKAEGVYHAPLINVDTSELTGQVVAVSIHLVHFCSLPPGTDPTAGPVPLAWPPLAGCWRGSDGRTIDLQPETPEQLVGCVVSLSENAARLGYQVGEEVLRADSTDGGQTYRMDVKVRDPATGEAEWTTYQQVALEGNYFRLAGVGRFVREGVEDPGEVQPMTVGSDLTVPIPTAPSGSPSPQRGGAGEGVKPVPSQASIVGLWTSLVGRMEVTERADGQFLGTLVTVTERGRKEGYQEGEVILRAVRPAPRAHPREYEADFKWYEAGQAIWRRTFYLPVQTDLLLDPLDHLWERSAE